MAVQDVEDREPILVTDIIGNIGKYQIVVLSLLFYWNAISGSSGVTVELLAPIVTMHWDWDTPATNRTTFLSTHCKMDDILNFNRTSGRSNASAKLIFESQYSKRTLTEELELVCERSWLVSFANSAYMCGCLIGSLAVPLAEKFGRRPYMMYSLVLTILSNLLVLFSNGYTMFAISMFLMGAACILPGVFMFAQVAEVVPVSKLPFYGTLGRYGIIFGQIVMVGVAWAVKNWFHLQIFQISFVGVLLFISWYLLESPAWLAVRGKFKESSDTLSRIVERNGLDLAAKEPKIEAWLQQMKSECKEQSMKEKGRWSDLFKNRTITFYTCGSSFVLLSLLGIFYGVTMNTESFGSGMYEDLAFSNLLSVGSMSVTLIALTRTSLRLIIITFCLFEGLVCAVYPFLHQIPVARSILTVLSLGFISPSCNTSFTYIASLFPTSVRALGLGFTTMLSRTSAIASPFTKELGERTVPYLPFVLFAVLSFASALLMKLFPETKGKPLAHTVENLRPKNKEDKPTEVTKF